VDEVDSILIDEAGTPLIISGQADDNLDVYTSMNKLVPHLVRQLEIPRVRKRRPRIYSVDEKNQQILLTESGHEHAEELLAKAGLLPAVAACMTPQYHADSPFICSLKAHVLYHIDQNYVVQNDEVVIVDEFTGRMMPGRRCLTACIRPVEAKEGWRSRGEPDARLYHLPELLPYVHKLSGMTGTADTEAFEFQQIYALERLLFPTPPDYPCRHDGSGLSERHGKIQAVIKDIRDCYERGQPVLVGTTSIETSELLSGLLDKENCTQVLNAKQHAREAEIVAQAGRPKMVTIATNMPGAALILYWAAMWKSD